METATISLASPRSRIRRASSRAISSKGLMLILTPSVSTPLPSDFTRTRTLKSTTRFSPTSIFSTDDSPGPFAVTCASRVLSPSELACTRRGNPRLLDDSMAYSDFLVTTRELHDHLQDPDWRVVDCRFDLAQPDKGFSDYLAGHIPGAVYAHLDRD